MAESQTLDALISCSVTPAPLKGRRKFNADLSNLQMDNGFTEPKGRWSVKSTPCFIATDDFVCTHPLIDLRPGEEGAFVFDLVDSETEIKETINILVSGMISIDVPALLVRSVVRHGRISLLSQFLWVLPQWAIDTTNS